MTDAPHCGYTVTDADGIEEPCGREATSWRWYQDVGEHEDCLERACDEHANVGGRLLAELRACAERCEAGRTVEQYALISLIETLTPHIAAEHHRWAEDHCSCESMSEYPYLHADIPAWCAHVAELADGGGS